MQVSRTSVSHWVHLDAFPNEVVGFYVRVSFDKGSFVVARINGAILSFSPSLSLPSFFCLWPHERGGTTSSCPLFYFAAAVLVLLRIRQNVLPSRPLLLCLFVLIP